MDIVKKVLELEDETINDGRVGLKRGTDGPGSGTRTDLDYINLTRLQNAKSNNVRISDASKFKYLPNEENITYTDYKDKKTGKVTRKYNVRVRMNVDKKQKVITKDPKFQNINSLEEAKKIRDELREKIPKNIKPRDPEKDYITKDKRKTAEKATSGRLIKFSAPKGYVAHHMVPLAGRLDMTDRDIAVISEKMNTAMSKYDKPMNDLVNESMELDFNDTKSLKRLDEINKELADYVKKMEKELGPKYKGLLGFNKLTPVLDTFDDKGRQVFSIEKVGTDYKKSIGGKKEGKPLRDIRLKDIQKKVLDAPKFKSKIPGLTDLFEMAKSIPDDVKKAKYLKAGFKTLGIAASPLVIYDTYKAFEQGKPILESLEQGLIGTDLIGGAKRVLSLTPEERTARSVVKQDALKDLNLDMPMGFGFIEGPTPDTNMTLEEAQRIAAAGDERVKALEAQKNLERATSRSNFFGNLRDKIFGAPQSLSFAGGGIAGLSGGDTEGAMLKSMNPDKDGLQGLLKRVKKG